MPACFGMAGVYVLAVPGGPVRTGTRLRYWDMTRKSNIYKKDTTVLYSTVLE
jgi:hypothetical protein